ncbi:MAG TPA: hypothetical protein VNT01_11840 [Symbiobacteriaceae bacterium]|nr:hypothetical protein [Symbiobacteriaceae bacterium]
MQTAQVQAPVPLLLDPKLTATAKVLWLALRTATGEPITPAGLAAATNLTPATVHKGLAQLASAGWYSPEAGAVDHAPASDKVTMPAHLLKETRVRPRAKLLYGILQTQPQDLTYSALSAAAGVSLITIRQLVRELAETGWIEATQANQLAPIHIALRTPEQDRCAGMLSDARRRLEAAQFQPEAIMKEYLSLLIDSDEFEDNARPGFLINPLTGERMELDRYYPHKVAFEYNGAQHYRVTDRFPSEHALSKQQARDLMKEALCARRGIQLIVIHREDLSLEGMRAQVGALLPLRDLTGHEELIELLEKVSR